jgi:hypothetical protein
LVEPPIGMGMRPLCDLRYLTRRGASWDLARENVTVG